MFTITIKLVTKTDPRADKKKLIFVVHNARKTPTVGNYIKKHEQEHFKTAHSCQLRWASGKQRHLPVHRN